MSSRLKTYLAHLSKEGGRSLGRFVIGNSSVDYDSFFGSIILAYLLTTTTGKLYQPIIDCSKEDLRLRFEIMATLERAKIDPEGLLFRESSEAYPKGEYSLYDHNERELEATKL
jgi:inorganic pyrophosphatase/exopolyphosphatase